ncbi:MAG: hypothetical protein AAGI23_07835 [Bacteroidota bacterium]
MKEYVRILLFSFVTSLLIFIGKNKVPLQFLIDQDIVSEEINMDLFQTWLFFTGIAVSGLWIPIQYAKLKNKTSAQFSIFNDLLAYNKENHFKHLKESIKERNSEFSTRIFKPEGGIIGWWNKQINKSVTLKLIHLEGISDTFHYRNLQFEVRKNEAEGLIGKAYAEEALCVDFDLTSNNYFMTKAQQSKLGNVRFCSAIPIYNNKQSKIIAILAVDSDSQMTFDEEKRKKWEEQMIYYAAFVDKHINI